MVDAIKINYHVDALDICFNVIRSSCVPNIVLHPIVEKLFGLSNTQLKRMIG